MKYTPEHEWIRVEGKYAYIGITDYAQNALGDIVFIELEVEENETIERGEIFGNIEAVKTVSELYTPVDGKIIEINETILDSPEIINSDPYGDGWILKIQVFDHAHLEELLTQEEYKKIIA